MDDSGDVGEDDNTGNDDLEPYECDDELDRRLDKMEARMEKSEEKSKARQDRTDAKVDHLRSDFANLKTELKDEIKDMMFQFMNQYTQSNTGVKRAAPGSLEKFHASEELTDEQLILAMDECEHSNGFCTQGNGQGQTGATLHAAVSPQFNE